MRSFKPYWDKYGLLTQSDGDGGDSAARTFTYFYFKFYSIIGTDERVPLVQFNHCLNQIHVGGGELIRHPDPTMWYSDRDRMTRDNEVAPIAAAGEYAAIKFLKQCFWFHVKSFFFTTRTRKRGVWKDPKIHAEKAARWVEHDYSWQMPDFAIQLLPMFIRSLRWNKLKFIVWIFDWELLASAYLVNFKCWLAKKTYDKWVYRFTFPFVRKALGGDEMNYAIRCHQAQHRIPTWLSKKAWEVYNKRPHQKTLPVASPNLFEFYDYETTNGPQSAIQYFFAKNNFIGPPIDLLTKEILK